MPSSVGVPVAVRVPFDENRDREEEDAAVKPGGRNGRWNIVRPRRDPFVMMDALLVGYDDFTIFLRSIRDERKKERKKERKGERT